MSVWDQIATTVIAEFSDIKDVTEITRVSVRLLIAALLGGLLGFEREQRGKSAGVKTHMLVCIGAALFYFDPAASWHYFRCGIRPRNAGYYCRCRFSRCGRYFKRRRRKKSERFDYRCRNLANRRDWSCCRFRAGIIRDTLYFSCVDGINYYSKTCRLYCPKDKS